MANYNTIEAEIDSNIVPHNNANLITGAKLNTTLKDIVDTLGDGYRYKGIVTPSSAAITTDNNVFVIALTPGIYTNFGGAVVRDGEVAVLYYDTAWHMVTAYNRNTVAMYEAVNKPLTAVSGIGIDTASFVEHAATTTYYAPVVKGEILHTTATAGGNAVSFRVAFSTSIPAAGVACSVQETYSPNPVTVDRYDVAHADGYFCISHSPARYTDQSVMRDPVSDIYDKLNTLVERTMSPAIAAGYVDATTGEVGTYAAYCYGTIDVSEARSVRFLSLHYASTSAVSIGYAFYDSNGDYIGGKVYDKYGSVIGTQEYVAVVPEGAATMKMTIYNDYMSLFYCYATIKGSLLDKANYAYAKLSPADLRGKKVSIIGDSISCFGTKAQTRAGGYNAPYWEVKACDVGQSIQSWVTWLDVYDTVDGQVAIHKTIGGVEITAAMIGTKQTFTPVAGDVGKCIGVARWAGAYTDKPWWQVMLDETGAVLCNNASWSGSRMCVIPEGSSRHDAFVLSEAYSEYTLGRVANRDADGNAVIPDVIIIYRGTNDFSAVDPEGGEGTDETEDITTPDMKTFTAITDTHNFTQSYIWTILKLREKYPNASIVLCTLNVFKQVNYGHFPTNNGTYTLPQYNDKIREIADLMGCDVIEFDKDGITFQNCYTGGYITDSATTPTHPSTKGHKVMGHRAVADIRYILSD